MGNRGANDSGSDLYYYRARYYDPSTGRFLSEDPTEFQGGINFYAYVRNQSTNLTDPRGLDDRCAPWVPDWLCNLILGRKSQPHVQLCQCTRTILKPQPLTPGSQALWCVYTCDCSPGKKFIVSWFNIKKLKDCKDLANCPYQVIAEVDTSSSDPLPTLLPDPKYPVTKEPRTVPVQ